MAGSVPARPIETSVEEVMSRDVVTLRPGDLLAVADDVMRLGRIRHMPVLDAEGALVGIVSRRDFLAGALVRVIGVGPDVERLALSELTAQTVMTRDVLTTTPGTPLSKAAGVMLEHRIGCLPVLRDGRLVGILTESDFVRRAALSAPR